MVHKYDKSGVEREGEVRSGDALKCLERPNPSWTIARFVALASRRGFSEGEWAELASLQGLAESWRERAHRAAKIGKLGEE